VVKRRTGIKKERVRKTNGSERERVGGEKGRNGIER